MYKIRQFVKLNQCPREIHHRWNVQDQERQRRKALRIFSERMTSRIAAAEAVGDKQRVDLLLRFKLSVQRKALESGL